MGVPARLYGNSALSAFKLSDPSLSDEERADDERTMATLERMPQDGE
ncbi:hypothetical protein ABZ357_24825 [Streptomyces sp. NPDC005917]